MAGAAILADGGAHLRENRIVTVRRFIPFLIALITTGGALSNAADWVSEAGDAQQSSWQRHESILTPLTVKNIRMLWTRRLGEEPGQGAPATPTILGHIITHRGIKELVFATGNANTIYAIDADLGTVFWERSLTSGTDNREPPPGCKNEPMPAPVITPSPAAQETAVDDEDDNDPAQGNRPVYALTSGGVVHEIHPSTGSDIQGPRVLPSPPSGTLQVVLASGLLYGAERGCMESSGKVWALDFKESGKARETQDATPGATVAVGTGGTVYSLLDRANSISVSSFASRTLRMKDEYRPPDGDAGLSAAPPLVFTWKGREWVAVLSNDGRVLLLHAASLGGTTHRSAAFRSDPLADRDGIRGSLNALASSEDARGTRWIYVASWNPSGGQIKAFTLGWISGRPSLISAWNSRNLVRPSRPVVAGGVLYTLASAPDGHTILYALDAASGEELYSSGNTVSATEHSSGVAVANGHVCFGASGNSLFCFGIPFEP